MTRVARHLCSHIVGLTTASLVLVAVGAPAFAGDAYRFPRRTLDAQPAPAGLSTDAADPFSELRVLRDHIATLADPRFEGRGPGTEGIDRAAAYIATSLLESGLEPLFGTAAAPIDGMLQEVTVDGPNRLIDSSVTLTGSGPDRAVELERAREYEVLARSGAANVTAPIAFVGYSVGRGPGGYRSYARTDDLDGRIAMILRFEPSTSRGRSLWARPGRRWSRHAYLESKIELAIRHGAGAVIIVDATAPPAPDHPPLPTIEEPSDTEPFDVPVISLDRDSAAALIARADPENRSLDELAALANRQTRHCPIMFDLHATIRIDVRTAREQIRTVNVGALVTGRGALARQHIIIGAHYDHLGYGRLGGTLEGTDGSLHPGADDNASGVAALLLLAEWIAERYARAPPDADRRSIAFVAFTAEELGLLGSRRFVQDSPVDLHDVRLMINLDMIGRVRNERAFVEGLDTLDDLEQSVLPVLRDSPLRFRRPRRALGRSDHVPFRDAGLPALHLFSGIHDDYHTPRDTPEKIDLPGIALIAHVVEAIALDTATASDAPGPE